MAAIEWAVLCESAFLDRGDRLCVIKIVTQFTVPALPLTIGQIVLVARLVETSPHDEIAVGVGLATPSGKWIKPDSSAFDVDQAAEYLLVTLRDIPLAEAGLYRIAVSLGAHETAVELQVNLVTLPVHAGVH